MADYYKPLTPEFRRQINESIAKGRQEIGTCKPTAYTEMYNLAYTSLETLVNNLPDGFPMPMKGKRNE